MPGRTGPGPRAVESLESRWEFSFERLETDVDWSMIHFQPDGRADKELQVLCLGSHSDDIEIGCGGTILRLAEQYPRCLFHWVVFSAIGVREAEAQRAATLFVDPAQLMGPLLKSFQDGFMPFLGAEVKAVFEELKQQISPDIIFTHNRVDAHQVSVEGEAFEATDRIAERAQRCHEAAIR